MTAMQAHNATAKLALLGVSANLVVAIEAAYIFQIRRGEETPTRAGPGKMFVLDVEGSAVAGWNLSEMIGVITPLTMWVLIDHPTIGHRFALGLSRCTVVQALPSCMPLPQGLFAARGGAMAAGFLTESIQELAGYPTGVVIDVANILSAEEHGHLQTLNRAKA